MNCEEFEAIGLGLECESRIATGADAAERAAALEHANSCPRCAALQESWQEARLGLQAWRDTTRRVETPARIEMRLRQEFRTKHHTLKLRRRAMFAAWTLATAAGMLTFVSWWNWHLAQNGPRQEAGLVGTGTSSARTSGEQGGVNETVPADTNDQGVLLADNEGFTLLPGSLPQETQDAAIFRVRLQREALAELGLPVNLERASDWIQVDLLVGEDGQPRAVRLPAQSSD